MPRESLLWVMAGGLFLASSLVAAPKDDWLPVTAEELASKAPLIETGAAAEVLFRKIEIDDRDLPGTSVTREYIRYKVYQPEKAESITRISRQENSLGGAVVESEVTLNARLILPDGTIKAFGREAIRERTLAESAAEKTFLRRLFGSDNPAKKEKFLAISGIEAGSIVEYRIQTTYSNAYSALSARVLQTGDFPARRVEFHCQAFKGTELSYRGFLLNRSIGKATMESGADGREVKVTATNLPSMPREPFSGTPGDYALVVLNCYSRTERRELARSKNSQSFTINPNETGPWSPAATTAYLKEADFAVETPRLKKTRRGSPIPPPRPPTRPVQFTAMRRTAPVSVGRQPREGAS